MNISQESNPRSQVEIPVLSSYGKNFEYYIVCPRTLFNEKFCGWHVSSGHTEREVQLRMFASYIHVSLGLVFLFSFGDKLLHV